MKHLIIICLLFSSYCFSQNIATFDKDKGKVKANPVKTTNNKVNDIINFNNSKKDNNSAWRVYFIWIKNDKGERTKEYYLYRPKNKQSSSERNKEIKKLYGHKKYQVRMTYLEKGEIACIYDGKIFGDKKNGFLGKYKNLSKSEVTKKCKQKVEQNHGENMKIITN